jgi:hypothetical protein
MSNHVRPPQYAWGYDWFDDCPPPYNGRVAFMQPPPARARVAVHLPPCKPHAGINTDWRGNKCAMLHNNYSSYASMPTPPAQPQASLPAQPQASPPAQPQASQPAPPQTSQLVPPAQPTAPKPAADPVTVVQAARDDVHQESAMGSLGFDVTIGLGLALVFAVVRHFILDMIEPPRPSS